MDFTEIYVDSVHKSCHVNLFCLSHHFTSNLSGNAYHPRH